MFSLLDTGNLTEETNIIVNGGTLMVLEELITKFGKIFVIFLFIFFPIIIVWFFDVFRD